MSQSISKKAKTPHVEHEYGQEIAKLLDNEDMLSEHGSADNKKLKRQSTQQGHFAPSQVRHPSPPA
jgi:hypothetical protein